MAQKYGKTFTCRRGKYKGKRVKYLYSGKSKKMVLASKNRRW